MKRIYKYCLVVALLNLDDAAHGSGADTDEHQTTPVGSGTNSGRSSPPEVPEKTMEEKVQEKLRRAEAAMARNAERESIRAGEYYLQRGATGRGKIILY